MLPDATRSHQHLQAPGLLCFSPYLMLKKAHRYLMGAALPPWLVTPKGPQLPSRGLLGNFEVLGGHEKSRGY